jgi:hypothetical protein
LLWLNSRRYEGYSRIAYLNAATHIPFAPVPFVILANDLGCSRSRGVIETRGTASRRGGCTKDDPAGGTVRSEDEAAARAELAELERARPVENS